MEEVRTLLKEPLSTEDGNALAFQLVQAEAWQARVSVEYRQAEEELSRVRMQLYNPEWKNELERKTNLEGLTRTHQRTVDELGDISDILKRRISLGQTLLKNFSQEMSSGLR